MNIKMKKKLLTIWISCYISFFELFPPHPYTHTQPYILDCFKFLVHPPTQTSARWMSWGKAFFSNEIWQGGRDGDEEDEIEKPKQQLNEPPVV